MFYYLTQWGMNDKHPFLSTLSTPFAFLQFTQYTVPMMIAIMALRHCIREVFSVCDIQYGDDCPHHINEKKNISQQKCGVAAIE